MRLDYLLAGLSLAAALLVAALIFVSPASTVAAPQPPKGIPWSGPGMWVWYVKQSPQQLASELQRLRVKTVFIKSADGSRAWDQLTPELVDTLHRSGIHVCGWQYVYGKRPLEEARAAARLRSSGARCFVIDAEVEYKRRSAEARIYIKELRRLLGRDFRVGFTSFPYVSLHSSLPYRVFLGPGGAEANLPQMYWHEIGFSARRVVRETLSENRSLGRPVYPIGQTYRNPPARQISSFVSEVERSGLKGFSWWSLDSSSAEQKRLLSRLHYRFSSR